MANRKLTDSQRLTVVTKHRNGVPNTAIALEFGVSEGTVRKILKNFGGAIQAPKFVAPRLAPVKAPTVDQSAEEMMFLREIANDVTQDPQVRLAASMRIKALENKAQPATQADSDYYLGWLCPSVEPAKPEPAEPAPAPWEPSAEDKEVLSYFEKDFDNG